MSYNAIQSGDILQVKSFRDNEVSGTTAAFSSTTTFASFNFTPKSATSRLIFEMDMDYKIRGYGDDEFQVLVRVGGVSFYEKRQRFLIGGDGGGTRSTVLFPLKAIYINSSVSTKAFDVQITRIAGDDTMEVYTFRSVTVTEVKN
jgi:hypothetical protein